jgi:hypothetical protein
MGNCSTCDLTLRDEADPGFGSLKPGMRKKDPFQLNNNKPAGEKPDCDDVLTKNLNASVVDSYIKDGEFSKIYTEEGESFIYTVKEPAKPASSKAEKKTKRAPLTREAMTSHSDFPNNLCVNILEKIPSIKNEIVRKTIKENGRFNKKAEYISKFQIDCVKFPPLELYQGVVYFGHWRDKQRQGFGRQLWPDGTFYEGFWDADLTNGYGRLIHSDGTFYEGEWLNDKAHGKGVILYFSKKPSILLFLCYFWIEFLHIGVQYSEK